jgi:hypothetical protein
MFQWGTQWKGSKQKDNCVAGLFECENRKHSFLGETDFLPSELSLLSKKGHVLQNRGHSKGVRPS